MTTLSKEDIVRWARSAGFSGTHSNVLMADGEDLISLCKLEEFATLARADIVKANKALVAENERLKNYLSGERDKLLDTANTIDQLTDQLINQLTAIRTALAAAEAREEKMRGWLDRWCKFDSLNMDLKKWFEFSAEYKAFNRDDSALRRLLAEAKAGVYEECAKYFDERADWEMFGARVADYIRELAEKAKEEAC